MPVKSGCPPDAGGRERGGGSRGFQRDEQEGSGKIGLGVERKEGCAWFLVRMIERCWPALTPYQNNKGSGKGKTRYHKQATRLIRTRQKGGA